MRSKNVTFASPVSRRLASAAGLLALILVIGTVGYIVLSGMTFVEALYQTVTTVTTVGFRELRPFGVTEELFTIALILSGVGTAFYTLTLVVQDSLEGDISSRFYKRKKAMEIARLRNHYLLCGFGRVGQEIARELQERGAEFVVIERAPEQAELARAFGYHVIEGDASEERTLVAAGLSTAACLLAAGDSDSGNTFIVLTARSVNGGCFIVARASAPQNAEKLRLAGADRVLSLYSLGGRRMVLLALQPLATDFMDTLVSGRESGLVLAEIEVSSKNGLAGRRCSELVKDTVNATLLGVRRVSGELIVGPRSEAVLGDGDIVIVIAEEADIAQLNASAAGTSGE